MIKRFDKLKAHFLLNDNTWNLVNMVIRVLMITLAWLITQVSAIFFDSVPWLFFIGLIVSLAIVLTGYLYIPKLISSFNPVTFKDDKYFNSAGTDLSNNLPKSWGKSIAASIWIGFFLFFFGIAPLTGLLVPIILPTIYLIMIKCPYSIYYANHPSKEYFENLSGVYFSLKPIRPTTIDNDKYYYDPSFRSSSCNIYNRDRF